MTSKVNQRSRQTSRGVELLRSNDVRNSGYEGEPPDGTEKWVDSGGPRTSYAECELVKKLHKSCNLVQFFGVTAAVIAFLAFAIPNLDKLTAKENWVRTMICCTPLVLAYLLSFNHLFLTNKISNNPKSLLKVCWLIYFLDVLCLGALVVMTGGPSNSLFIPLFLLIPTAMSCYCSPKRWPFWSIIIISITAYAIAAYIESVSVSAGAGAVASAVASASADADETLKLIKGWVIIKGAVKPEEGARQLISGIFATSCILIAAYCSFVTHNVRTEYCLSQRKHEGITPNICEDLCC